MDSKIILEAINKRIENTPFDIVLYEDAFSCIRNIGKENNDTIQVKETHNLMNKIRKVMALAKDRAIPNFTTRLFEVNRKCLLYNAPECFDDFMLYMEINRPMDKQFYLPRRKQLKVAADAMEKLAKRELELLAISMPPGVGKALANDTPILTKNGWKKHGNLVVGDEVIGLNGEFKKVVAVHPKCQLDCLIEFTNGEKIQCHENHEWKFYDRNKRKLRLEETKVYEKCKLEAGARTGRGHRYNFQLPPHDYVIGEQKDLPLDPYTLGVWLGDGANKNPRIANPISDIDIVNKIVSNGVKVRWKTQHKITGVWYYDFDIRENLQFIGMCHSRKTTTKHIPEQYITASINQRLELLAGLLDTDGTLADNGRYHFSTSEPALRDGVVELISTFGWRASVVEYEPHESTKLVNGNRIIGKKKTWVVGFNADCIVPCALERKRVKAPRKQRKISVKSITRVEPKQGNCITVEGDGMYLAGRTMIPTHNTSLALFFLAWLAGRDTQKPILTGSHNKDFLSGIYGECLRLLDPQGEYLWHDIFPNKQIINTNAKTLMIDIGKDKTDMQRFMTLEFTSIGSGNAGKVRAENLLYCDDLVDGLETALSKERLDKLWGMYTTDLRQRKIGDCVELHIATRWSVHDVISRLERMYDNNPKAKFITMSALNENEESNFDYPIEAGFTTKFYLEQREMMDDASWRALYMNQPIEREGQLYSEKELRRYFELPDGEADAIVSVCDTKDKGTDYCVMPIAYQYGNDYYIEDVICDNSNPDIVEPRLVSKCLQHKIQMSRFESNSAGGKVAEKIQQEVKANGGRTKITTKYTTQNKETKIIMASPYVLEHFLFKDDTVIKDNKEYRKFLNFLCSYTMAGKNKNDDVPDAIAMLADYVQSFTAMKAEIFKRFW